MRVLLASGLFYPDVGGPATHVRKIAEKLSKSGHDITVVAFGNSEEVPVGYRVIRISRKLPRVYMWTLYALRILREAIRSDVVYAFDLTTAGMPAAFAATVLRKPLAIRIGGDPIWERVVESGQRFLSLDSYYAQALQKKDKPVLYSALRFLLRRADRIVVYNTLFRDFYSKHFAVAPERITVIRNPLLPREKPDLEKNANTFLFAGRFVAYKNLALVIRAAARLVPHNPQLRLVFIGDGPEKASLEALASSMRVPLEIRPKADQMTLFQAIRNSSVAIAPALSEFNPNFILESLSLGKPVLISRGHGLSVNVPEYMEFDPRSEESLASAMEAVLLGYERALDDVQKISMEWSWDDVLLEHEKLLNTLV